MEARTDLAVESLDFAGDLAPEGVAREVFRKNGVEVTRVRVLREPSGSASPRGSI